jgi:hypothetical protein
MATALDTTTTTFIPGAEADAGAFRSEVRDEKIRIVEYSCFPRVASQQRSRIGFTRDISHSGICLGVDRSEPVGSLLRLSLRDIEGSTGDTCVGRVVWNSSERDGRHWLGLEVLTPARAERGEESRAPTAVSRLFDR